MKSKSARIQQTISAELLNEFEKVGNKRAFIEEAITILLYAQLPAEIYQAARMNNIEKLKGKVMSVIN